MMQELARFALSTAQSIQQELAVFDRPPEEGSKPRSNQVISFSLVKRTRGYIEKVVDQINGSYENGLYDSCAVMIRRLVETLIIEAFEYHHVDSAIKNPNGDFLYLRDLIDKSLSEKSWNLGRNCKQALPKLKNIGDMSAHSRRYNAHRADIDNLIESLRIVVQELVELAHLKSPKS